MEINQFYSSQKYQEIRKIIPLDGHRGEILEPVDVANTFCEYFSTVANRLDTDIPLTNTDLMYYMPDPEPACFSLSLSHLRRLLLVKFRKL